MQASPRGFLVLAGLGAMISGHARAQEVFDAASVKLFEGRFFVTGFKGGPGTSDPGRVAYTQMSLKNVLSQAYDARYDAIVGPPWLEDVHVDIVATMPRGTTKAQFRSMVVHLLEERFKLVAHMDTKLADGYSLVVAEGGPRLKAAKENPPVDESVVEGSGKVDRDGFPLTRGGPGIHKVCLIGACRWRVESATMDELAGSLACHCPIVNETHLTGPYAFTLTADQSPLLQLTDQQEEAKRSGLIPNELVAKDGIPDIFRALQTQLGLKLERKKVPGKILVVDHIEKSPSEN